MCWSLDSQEELQFILSFYGSDFDSLQLSTQLEIFSQSFKTTEEVTLSDIFGFFHNCTPAQVDLLCQVSKLVMLLLVMPATNAQSERSFSALRRIKTYLRSTMAQQRLNNLMVLQFMRVTLTISILLRLPMTLLMAVITERAFFGSEFKQSDYEH